MITIGKNTQNLILGSNKISAILTFFFFDNDLELTVNQYSLFYLKLSMGYTLITPQNI